MEAENPRMKGSDVMLLLGSIVLVAVTFQQPEKVVVESQPVITFSAPVKTEEPQVVPQAVEPVIVMHSSTDCVHCDRWWSQRDKWEKLGWRVEKVIDLGPVDGHRLWPWFDVLDRDGRFTVDGFMDGKRFTEAKRKALKR